MSFEEEGDLLLKQRCRALWGNPVGKTQRFPSVGLVAKPRSTQPLLEASTMPLRRHFSVTCQHMTSGPPRLSALGDTVYGWEVPSETWWNKSVNKDRFPSAFTSSPGNPTCAWDMAGADTPRRMNERVNSITPAVSPGLCPPSLLARGRGLAGSLAPISQGTYCRRRTATASRNAGAAPR